MIGEIKNPFKLEDGCQLSSRYPSFNNANSLVSGKEAKLAWAHGDTVGYIADDNVWFVDENTPLGVFDSFKEWQIKPRTISINGIEVPAPFKPKIGDKYWILETSNPNSYSYISSFQDDEQDKNLIKLGAWRTEEEVKQVVEALRSVFKCLKT